MCILQPMHRAMQTIELIADRPMLSCWYTWPTKQMASWGKLAEASWRIRHLAPQHSKLQQMIFSDDEFEPAATTDRHTEYQEPFHPPQQPGPSQPSHQPGPSQPPQQPGPAQPPGPSQPLQQPGSYQPPMQPGPAHPPRPSQPPMQPGPAHPPRPSQPPMQPGPARPQQQDRLCLILLHVLMPPIARGQTWLCQPLPMSTVPKLGWIYLTVNIEDAMVIKALSYIKSSHK